MELRKGERFFRARLKEPDGHRERILTGKANKALAMNIATLEAAKTSWYWLVEPVQVEQGEQGLELRLLEQWSSMAGHEVFDPARPTS